MNTKTNIKEDIISQQQQIIKELRQRVEYLERVEAEFQELKDAFGNDGRTSYNTAMQSILTRRSAAIQAERDRKDWERQNKRNIAAGEREAELEKQVLQNHPDLTQRLAEGKAALEKDQQSGYKITNKWFDMSEEDFQKYLKHSVKIDESPVSWIITVD